MKMLSSPSRRARALAIVPLLANIALFGACDDDDDSEDAAAVIAIQGREFAFEGVPATLAAGTHTFSFENIGSEVHELIVLKLPDGMALEQLLELPEEESDAFFYAGVQTILFAQPGQVGTATFTAALTPGTYGVLCFIENENEPHVIQGMLAELAVGS